MIKIKIYLVLLILLLTNCNLNNYKKPQSKHEESINPSKINNNIDYKKDKIIKKNKSTGNYNEKIISSDDLNNENKHLININEEKQENLKNKKKVKPSFDNNQIIVPKEINNRIQKKIYSTMSNDIKVNHKKNKKIKNRRILKNQDLDSKYSINQKLNDFVNKKLIPSDNQEKKIYELLYLFTENKKPINPDIEFENLLYLDFEEIATIKKQNQFVDPSKILVRISYQMRYLCDTKNDVENLKKELFENRSKIISIDKFKAIEIILNALNIKYDENNLIFQLIEDCKENPDINIKDLDMIQILAILSRFFNQITQLYLIKSMALDLGMKKEAKIINKNIINIKKNIEKETGLKKRFKSKIFKDKIYEFDNISSGPGLKLMEYINKSQTLIAKFKSKLN